MAGCVVALRGRIHHTGMWTVVVVVVVVVAAVVVVVMNAWCVVWGEGMINKQ